MTQMNWPLDADGNPMAIVVGTAQELVPTVQYGNFTVGPVQIWRPVPNGSRQDVINAARKVQRDAEFVVGQERRGAQWAMAGLSADIRSPIPKGEEFAAPPPGYDSASMPSHPADAPQDGQQNSTAPAA